MNINVISIFPEIIESSFKGLTGKALEKNGFFLEGIRKKHLFFCGEFFDSLEYGLLL